MPWIVGEAGILGALGVILVTMGLAFIAALSMAAIATNGKVPTGGTYFVLSRSLGAEVGAAIGTIYIVGNVLTIALNSLAFGETLDTYLRKEFGLYLIEDVLYCVRVYGVSVLVVIIVVSFLTPSLRMQTNVDLVMAVIFLIAVLSVLIGAFWQRKTGDVEIGFSGAFAQANLMPSFTPGINMFTVFAVFFPIATGVVSPLNMVPQLENTAVNFPVGVFSGIAVSTFVCMFVFVCVCVCVYLSLSSKICFFFSDCLMAIVIGCSLSREDIKSLYLVLRFESIW